MIPTRYTDVRTSAKNYRIDFNYIFYVLFIRLDPLVSKYYYDIFIQNQVIKALRKTYFLVLRFS